MHLNHVKWAALFVATSGLILGCTSSEKSVDGSASNANYSGRYPAQAQDAVKVSHQDEGILPDQTDDDDDENEVDIQANDPRRGQPWEYDPGAPKNSRWVELYGSAPNYRQIGKTFMRSKDEKFRWEFGPMWYRGRLGANQVKAFIVGQEGAQDENVTNRAFTGSTGTKTQNFLNHIGLNTSYLFMNTFVYTINGQLTDKGKGGEVVKNPYFDWLEQNLESPIVRYRNQLFDNMAMQNKDTIALFMGVGAGGKASLATWVRSAGGRCNAVNNLRDCDTEPLRKKFGIKGRILVIGVPHPGGASPRNGGTGALENIKRGFTDAAKQVAAFKIANSDWLPFDPGVDTESTLKKMQEPYEYKNAPVPFRDFAFGTNWRMGQSGTSSNRDGSDSIGVFATGVTYGAKGDYGRSKPKDETTSPSSFIDVRAGDMMWEPPKYFADAPERAQSYDYGPCGADENGDPVVSCNFATALGSFPLADAFKGVQRPKSHSSFGNLIGAYRGRASNPKIVILADQESHDDLFSTRALTGLGGQYLQTWIEASGVGKDYLIIKSVPYDTLGMNTAVVNAYAARKEVLAPHRKILSQYAGKDVILVTVGSTAKTIANKLMAANTNSSLKFAKRIDLDTTDKRTNWASALSSSGLPGLKTYVDIPTNIPRFDLPYHSRWWMGIAGSRAMRSSGAKDCTADKGCSFYRVTAPRFVTQMPAPRLDSETDNYLSVKLNELSAKLDQKQ